MKHKEVRTTEICLTCGYANPTSHKFYKCFGTSACPAKEKKQDKAFVWVCGVCGKEFQEHEEGLVLVYRCFLSGNTPILGKAEVYCETCYDAPETCESTFKRK